MIAAHNAHTDDSYAQRMIRAGYSGLHHIDGIPTPMSSTRLSPSMALRGWRPPLGNSSKHVLLQSVTAVCWKRPLFGGARGRHGQLQTSCNSVVQKGFYSPQGEFSRRLGAEHWKSF